MIRRLEVSAKETAKYTKERILVHQDMIKGLEQSKRANMKMIMGLEDSKHESREMIRGLEESKRESKDMIRGLEESVEKFKETIDDIYNSTTWKLVSKFTGGQTKRKKN